MLRKGILIGGIGTVVAALAWFTVVFGPSAPMTGDFDVAGLGIFAAVWIVGMVAMMLPSLVPMILIVSSTAARRRDKSMGSSAVLQTLVFGLGYFATWLGVGLVAYVALLLAFRYPLAFISGGQLGGVAAGLAVALAGLYQLSPLKKRALRACRSPMDFVMTRWREGTTGSFLMGFDYGFFCAKCCWAFMAVLVFVGGMSLLWMALFAGVIFVEKLAPRGVLVSAILAIGLLVGGVALALLAM